MTARARAADDDPSGKPTARRLEVVNGGMSGARRPNLFVNPLSDEGFARTAAELVSGGVAHPEELANQLRGEYPNVAARKREISGEAESWYVYRDGHWVDDDPAS